MVSGQLRKPPHTYVERKAHFKLNRAFRVIQGRSYWSFLLRYTNVDLISETYEDIATGTTSLHHHHHHHSVLTTVLLPENSLRILTNNLYCQKLDSWTYIFAADSVGLSSFKFVQWAPQDASFLQQSAYWPFKVIQGR